MSGIIAVTHRHIAGQLANVLGRVRLGARKIGGAGTVGHLQPPVEIVACHRLQQLCRQGDTCAASIQDSSAGFKALRTAQIGS